MDVVEFLYRQKEFSEQTFGPGDRTASVLTHLKKELIEVEGDPADDILKFIYKDNDL